MNKIFRTLIPVIAILFLIAGCKKDESKPLKKMQSAIYSSGFDTFEYTADGKLSKIFSSNNDYQTFTSTSSLASVTYFTYDKKDGSYTQRIENYTLNAQGYATGLTEVTTESNVTTTKTSTWTYDASGYITLEVIVTSSSSGGTASLTIDSTFSTYLNGNLVTSTRNRTTKLGSTITSTSKIISTYEYFMDRENTLGYDHMGVKIFGTSSKNLLKQKTSSGFGSSESYMYEFDADGYVIKKVTLPGGSNVSYTWE